jgi:hypothetical protein
MRAGRPRSGNPQAVVAFLPLFSENSGFALQDRHGQVDFGKAGAGYDVGQVCR